MDTKENKDNINKLKTVGSSLCCLSASILILNSIFSTNKLLKCILIIFGIILALTGIIVTSLYLIKKENT